MRLVLFQPEIPENAGTLLRLSACLGIEVDMIEPFGFLFSERRLKRAGMDYIQEVSLTQHNSWNCYTTSVQRQKGRLILLSSEGSIPYYDFAFQPTDALMVGRESTGVSQEVKDSCDAVVSIPMRSCMRSLNVAVAASMVLGEALRQTHQFPKEER